jgi:hypothetical protein
MEYTIHSHALEAMIERDVSIEILDAVMQHPDQILQQPNGRTVFQSRMENSGKKLRLLRVIVDMKENPPLVITVIPTSQFTKYWRN